MYEELKYEQARKDAKYWFDNGTYRQSQNLSLEEKYDIAEELIFRHFAFNPWNFLEGAKVTEYKVLEICAKLNEKDYDAAAYRFMDCWKEYDQRNEMMKK